MAKLSIINPIRIYPIRDTKPSFCVKQLKLFRHNHIRRTSVLEHVASKNPETAICGERLLQTSSKPSNPLVHPPFHRDLKTLKKKTLKSSNGPIILKLIFSLLRLPDIPLKCQTRNIYSFQNITWRADLSASLVVFGSEYFSITA